MPLSTAMIVTAAAGFCLSASAGSALAANSQFRPAYPVNVCLAKGGSMTMHRKGAADPAVYQAGRASGGREAVVGSGRFAALPENHDSLDRQH